MKKVISVILMVCLICSSAVLAHPFKDVSGHWAETEIEKGYINNIINGDPDGRFRPDDCITRAEFIKMIASAVCTRFEAEIPQSFDDGIHWASKYYNFASNALYTIGNAEVEGIVPGYFKNLEDFDLPIPRWEMAFLLAETFANTTYIAVDINNVAEFADETQIEALPQLIALSIRECKALEFMNGDETNQFNPHDKGTRAEAVAVINRLDTKLAKLIEEIETTMKEQEDQYLKELEDDLVVYEDKDIPKNHPVATIVMDNNKKIMIELYPEYAPQTVANFVTLAKEGFYNGLTFHRVVEGFMAQGGDPNGDGTGGSGGYIKGEFSSNGFDKNTLSHKRGIISMARSSHPDSASSQFFICYADAPFLDGEYAAFGKVIQGMNVVDDFTDIEMKMNEIGEASTPTKPIVIKSITVNTK